MGVLACMRSVFKSGKFIGCMITASHNPVQDNGCKLIDPHGDMLENEWEAYATKLVNSKYLTLIFGFRKDFIGSYSFTTI